MGVFYLHTIILINTFDDMLDLAYQTVLTLLSKDNQGYLPPEELDRLANLAQMEIFRGYFEDENRDKNRQNKGQSNEGYSNLPFNQRQRITEFAETSILTYLSGRYRLPTNLYLLEEDGLSVISTGNVAEEIERKDLNYIKKTISKPTEMYPVYEKFSDSVIVYPNTIITTIECRYLRIPKKPRWTYFVLPNNEVKYDPTNPSFQDFELHESEFSNLVIRMLSYSGVTIGADKVVQVAESIKQQTKQESEY